MSLVFRPCNQPNNDNNNCAKNLQLASASADKTIIIWKLKEILDIETDNNGKTALESLFNKGCQLLSVYLETNPETQEAEDIRSACGNIKPQQD